ncbi:MAG: methyltransferase domain-containing protein, partial [Nitrosopumilaceae archaeon]
MSYKTRDSTERDLKYSENEHDFLILLSGSEKKVLEFGPAPEYVSKALKERHCHVTSIEKNAILAKQAKQFVDRTIVADIETTNLSEILGYEKYDVILLSNFLERLKEPLQLLKKLSKFLSKNGHIVCS